MLDVREAIPDFLLNAANCVFNAPGGDRQFELDFHSEQDGVRPEVHGERASHVFDRLIRFGQASNLGESLPVGSFADEQSLALVRQEDRDALNGAGAGGSYDIWPASIRHMTRMWG